MLYDLVICNNCESIYLISHDEDTCKFCGKNTLSYYYDDEPRTKEEWIDLCGKEIAKDVH